MTVIEALFITLGFDTSEFDKKQKEALAALTKLGETSDKKTKDIAESGKKAANTFSMLKVEVLGALAAFGMSDGLKDFLTTNMNGEAALGRMANNLSMSTQKLEAWKLAAKEMGQSGDDAVGALQAVAKGVAEAQITGHSALTQASRRFGFAIDTKSPEQTLINISRRMAETHDRQQAMQIAEAAGVGNISNLLLQGPDKLHAQLAHTMSLTGAATKESTEQAAKLQAQWADLQERFRQVGERVFAKLEPVLERLGMQLANWLDRIDWNKLLNRIDAFIGKVNEVVKSLGGWKTIAEVLGGVLAVKLLSPLIGLLGVFGRLIPALGGVSGGIAAIGPAVAIAAAAFGGWKLGEWIASNMSPKLQDQIGHFVATLLAAAGNKEAQEAIATEEKTKAIDAAQNDPNVSPSVKKAAAGKLDLHDPAVIKMLSDHAAAQAKAEGKHLGQLDLGSDFFGKYDPQKTRKFDGNNAGMFALREQEYGLPTGTLERKFQIESNSGRNLFSPAGAQGPMQIMPATAKEMGLTTGMNGSVMDLDAATEAAAAYLAKLHKQFGSWDMAQAAYNWGPGNLKKDIALHGDRWLEFAPKETQDYIAKSDAGRALNYAKSVPLTTQTPAMTASLRHGGNTDNSNTVTINTLNVNAPKATDAKGVAKGMQSAMVSHPLIGGVMTSLA